MGLFSKRSESESAIDDSWVRCTALVVKADAPPQGAPSFGSDAHGTIIVLVDSARTGRRQLSAAFKYAEDHWVVAGMDIPIAIDPRHPETFVVEWSAVPSMRQQVAADHPALADPFAASRRIAGALGITPSEKTAAMAERFQAALSDAATKPAPAGRVRGVAMTASVRGRFDAGGSDPDGGSTSSAVTLLSSSQAVLSVAVPGRAPYAVFVPKFKIPRKRLSIPGEAIPVTVSITDPSDVELLWDEMPGLGDQISARMSDSARQNAQLTATLAAQMQAAQARAIAAYQAGPGAPAPQPGYPPPAQPGYPAATPGYPAPVAQAGGYVAGTMPPAMRQALIDNLKRSLVYMPDRAQRQMILDQYRAMGLDITLEELGL
ncbi:MAG TPA: hypothetical protein VGF84_23020 [Micromonosporaceae bacterium]|jgi:hypothetical protein